MGLKCQFHIHVKGDPMENIGYSAKELIDEAQRLGFDVLAITCHKEMVFKEKWKKYAEEKGILLIPGAEIVIKRKHVLCINTDEDINKVKTFEDLKRYKEAHPESLIIAPHPFFPGSVTLKKDLEKNIDLFDAIELCWAYTKYIDFNRKAAGIAEKHKKPLIATADCHLLKQLQTGGHCIIDAKPKISSIINTIKKSSYENRKIKNIHSPTTISKIIAYFIQVGWYHFTKLCQHSQRHL